MKTVIDAVNKCRGEWPNGYVMTIATTNGEVNYGEFIRCVAKLETNFGASQKYSEYKKGFRAITEINFGDNAKPSKPVTLSPIYKKEEFEFTDMSGDHTIKSKHILCCADTGRVVAVFYNERDLIAATGLTKKVELVDGKAYQFDVEMSDKYELNGIYNKRENNFTMIASSTHESYFTNIQLLEVKS